MTKRHNQEALRRYRAAICNDCGMSTTPKTRLGKIRARSWEWYMVHAHIWAQAGMTDGFLCIGCLERRLGRHLKPDDFRPTMSKPEPLDTPRLAARKTGQSK
jgi:hypothetical protein